MLTGIVLISLSASFIISLLIKWGVVEYMQVHAPRLISKVANCDFCLSFWVCHLLSCVVFMYANWCFVPDMDVRHLNYLPLLYPIFCTPITRILI